MVTVDGTTFAVKRARRRVTRAVEILALTARIEALAEGEEFIYTAGAGGARKPSVERHADGFTVWYHVHERAFRPDCADRVAEFVWGEGDDGEPYGWTGLGNGFE